MFFFFSALHNSGKIPYTNLFDGCVRRGLFGSAGELHVCRLFLPGSVMHVDVSRDVWCVCPCGFGARRYGAPSLLTALPLLPPSKASSHKKSKKKKKHKHKDKDVRKGSKRRPRQRRVQCFSPLFSVCRGTAMTTITASCPAGFVL